MKFFRNTMFMILCLFTVLVSAPISANDVNEESVFGLPIQVHDFFTFKALLTSGEEEIDIKLISDFTLTEQIQIKPATKKVRILSDETVTLQKNSVADYIFLINNPIEIVFDGNVILDSALSKGMINIGGSTSGEVLLSHINTINSLKASAIIHTNLNMNLVITDGYFDNNKTNGSGGSVNFAGPQLSIIDSTFTNGYANYGGAISIENNSKLDFKNSRVDDCIAVLNGGAINGKNFTTINIISGEIIDNTATNGGAIHVNPGINGGKVVLGADNSYPIISGNKAIVGSVQYGAYNGFGGAIFSKEVIINNAMLKNNKAQKNGGAIYAGNVVIDGGIIELNEADKGGGIFAAGVVEKSNVYLEINEGIIRNNTALSQIDSQLGGGGVALGESTDKSTPEFYMNGGKIQNNISYSNGGGLSITGGSSVKIKDAEISDNQVLGTVTAPNYSKAGGGLYVRSSGLSTIIELSGDTKITNNNAQGNGGGIFTDGYLVKVSEGTEISFNKSELRNGGGVYSSSVDFINGIITGNWANLNGGGVYLGDVINESNFHDGIVKDNESVNGGGIYTTSPLKIDGTIKFINNSALNNGGAIFNTDDLTVDSGAEFSGNSAGNDGGALFLFLEDDKVADVMFAKFDSNTSIKDGGAIFVIAQSDVDGVEGLKRLFIREAVDFSNNMAGTAFNWYPDLTATDPDSISVIYRNSVFTSSSTEPFPSVYSNYDTGFGIQPLEVIFDFNSPADAMDSVTVHVFYNEKVSAILVSHLEKYDFVGWQNTKEPTLVFGDSVVGLDFFDFEIPITENRIIYGRWKELPDEPLVPDGPDGGETNNNGNNGNAGTLPNTGISEINGMGFLIMGFFCYLLSKKKIQRNQ